MSSPVREHRSPIRYSLRPTEVHDLATQIAKRDTVSDADVRNFAKSYNCATKTIIDVIRQTGTPLRTETSAKSMSPRQSAREAAESLFRKPAEAKRDDDQARRKLSLSQAKATGKQHSESLVTLAEKEATLAEREQRADRKIQQIKADAARQIEAERSKIAAERVELKAEREELEAERQKAKDAIEQTAELRRKTREDREELETARGTISHLARQLKSLEAKAEKYKTIALEDRAELKASMERERRLIAALKRAEEDIAKRDEQLQATHIAHAA